MVDNNYHNDCNTPHWGRDDQYERDGDTGEMVVDTTQGLQTHDAVANKKMRVSY